MLETIEYSEYFISMMEERNYDCGHAPTTIEVSDKEIIDTVEAILNNIDNDAELTYDR